MKSYKRKVYKMKLIKIFKRNSILFDINMQLQNKPDTALDFLRRDNFSLFNATFENAYDRAILLHYTK